MSPHATIEAPPGLRGLEDARMPDTSSLSASQLAFIRHASSVFVSLLTLAWWEAGSPPVRVSSFFRTVSENRAAGGSPTSQHLIGTAADLVGQRVGLAAACRRLGLVAVEEGTHLHVQLWPASDRAVERIAPQLISS